MDIVTVGCEIKIVVKEPRYDEDGNVYYVDVTHYGTEQNGISKFLVCGRPVVVSGISTPVADHTVTNTSSTSKFFVLGKPVTRKGDSVIVTNGYGNVILGISKFQVG